MQVTCDLDQDVLASRFDTAGTPNGQWALIFLASSPSRWESRSCNLIDACDMWSLLQVLVKTPSADGKYDV
ncbi:predicted protein [Pyrenophora tritici-repentis Pt-1C-BFP]|uniref:Uncharacterized protein n=1 Tax=Pyrenophora tritici-repentis (strain Pt-1C-BFP) TaxID=426418 RepID=B2W9I1_PYRTR|nr:uncharacterized protein PTRG_06639 [Pyrenophora tritici-repentis Pt-1C-BFP]EDU49559.1 predicted protein [Pyrenophora tritici-repentis Pt-1C-BFP]